MKSLLLALLLFLVRRQVSCLGLPADVPCADGPAIVLAIDVSGSMDSQDRLVKLGSVLTGWIDNRIPCGAKLGMVKFTSIAQILSNLTVIDEERRKELVRNIPTEAQGETCISCGVAEAMEVVKSNNSSKTAIVLITDADSSELVFDDDFKQSVSVSGIHVVVVMLGLGDKNQSIEIDRLMKSINGSARYIQDEHFPEQMLEALISVQNIFYDVASPPTRLSETTIAITSSLSSSTSKEPTTKASLDELPKISSTETISMASSDKSSHSSSTESTFLENLTVSVSFDNVTEETKPVEKSSYLFSLTVGVVVVVLVAIISIATYLYCRKRHNRPCAKRGAYQPPNYKYGDFVRANVASSSPYATSEDDAMYT